MTNFERYKTEILDYTINFRNFAVLNGRPAPCTEHNCNDCELGPDCNTLEVVLWLYREAEELPVMKPNNSGQNNVDLLIEDIEALDWYHVGKNGELIPGAANELEAVYKAKDLGDLLEWHEKRCKE